MDGFLKELHVQEGQKVQKGTILATFEPTPAEQRKLDDLENEFAMRQDVEKKLKYQINLVPPEARGEVKTQVAVATTKLEKVRKDMEWQQKWLSQQRHLVAPRDGVVMGLPKKARIGEEWKKDKSDVFCQVGDPTQLQVLLPVSPDDHDLLRESMAKAQANPSHKIPVIIRIQGRDMTYWDGEIAELPLAVAKEVPLELSTKGGGPLAVKPTSKEDELIPQIQVYLVPINIINPDNAIVPGALSQVKIYCEYRSAAWWSWRAISQTFDIGLM
jgi:multidrug efflux pump subunit AcrA (membrane-fusion protein)